MFKGQKVKKITPRFSDIDECRKPFFFFFFFFFFSSYLNKIFGYGLVGVGEGIILLHKCEKYVQNV